MSKPIALSDVVASLEFLEGREPSTGPELEARAFARLAPYRDGGVFVGGFSGASPWERHPADELVHVLSGAARLHLRQASGVETVELVAGTLVVVPARIWHRLEAPDGVTVLTVTPQPTDHEA